MKFSRIELLHLHAFNRNIQYTKANIITAIVVSERSANAASIWHLCLPIIITIFAERVIESIYASNTCDHQLLYDANDERMANQMFKLFLRCDIKLIVVKPEIRMIYVNKKCYLCYVSEYIDLLSKARNCSQLYRNY